MRNKSGNPLHCKNWLKGTSFSNIRDVKFASGIKNINFDFLPIHRFVLALYTQYFPESCEKISQACYSGGIQTLAVLEQFLTN